MKYIVMGIVITVQIWAISVTPTTSPNIVLVYIALGGLSGAVIKEIVKDIKGDQ